MKKFTFLLICVLGISLLAACGNQGSVDDEIFSSLIGEYQVVAQENDNHELSVGGWWHLSVLDEEGPYLSIYDNEAGNPGVEGKVVALDESNIKIETDPDLTDELPAFEWSLVGNKTFVNGEPLVHLHLTAAAAGGNVVGEHLLSAYISLTSESFVDIVDGAIDKTVNEELGIKEMKF